MRSRDLLAAGATLTGVALAWMLTGWMTPEAILLGAGAVVLLGWALGALEDARARRAWDQVAEGMEGARIVLAPLEPLPIGTLVGWDSDPDADLDEFVAEDGPPQIHHLVFKRDGEDGRKYVVRGRRCPVGGLVYGSRSAAEQKAAELDA
jgi:hypothetical protein